jgi:integrase
MAKIAHFKSILTKQGWMVSVPPSSSGSGKRIRRFFETEKLADAHGAKLRADYHKGLRAGVLEVKTAMLAAEAKKLLDPHNLSILDAAKMVVAQIEASGSTETFKERYDRFVVEMEPHWSPRYSHDMGKLVNWTGGEFFKLRVSEITPQRIKQALRDNGATAASTLDNRARYVSAVLKARGGRKRRKEIKILSVRHCAALLRASKTREERWAVALLLFAGIRPSAEDGEISRLQWEAVDSVDQGHIYVSAEVSKTNTDRHILITPRLARLLKEHPKGGPVVPANWPRVYARLRKDANLGREQDLLRHTFASNFLVAYGDDRCKEAMGHTPGSTTLFRHYRRSVVPAAGEKYFGKVK